jgi:hypothetical protein
MDVPEDVEEWLCTCDGGPEGGAPDVVADGVDIVADAFGGTWIDHVKTMLHEESEGLTMRDHDIDAREIWNATVLTTFLLGSIAWLHFVIEAILPILIRERPILKRW